MVCKIVVCAMEKNKAVKEKREDGGGGLFLQFYEWKSRKVSLRRWQLSKVLRELCGHLETAVQAEKSMCKSPEVDST